MVSNPRKLTDNQKRLSAFIYKTYATGVKERLPDSNLDLVEGARSMLSDELALKLTEDGGTTGLELATFMLHATFADIPDGNVIGYYFIPDVKLNLEEIGFDVQHATVTEGDPGFRPEDEFRHLRLVQINNPILKNIHGQVLVYDSRTDEPIDDVPWQHVVWYYAAQLLKDSVEGFEYAISLDGGRPAVRGKGLTRIAVNGAIVRAIQELGLGFEMFNEVEAKKVNPGGWVNS